MVRRYVECNRLYHKQAADITCLAFSPCGKYLATGALIGDACIWDVADGQLLHVFSGGIPILSLIWEGSGSDTGTVMCGLQNGTIACLIITQVSMNDTSVYCVFAGY